VFLASLRPLRETKLLPANKTNDFTQSPQRKNKTQPMRILCVRCSLARFA
jgi:hypothetical protein